MASNIYIVLDKDDKVLTADTAKYRIKKFLNDQGGDSILTIAGDEFTKQPVTQFLETDDVAS